MAVPAVIGLVYLVAAALFWRGQAPAPAVIAALLSPMAFALTVYMRRYAAAVAARAFLARKPPGVSVDDAIADLEARGESVTIDTDDVPQWPVTAVMLLALGALAALVWALLR